MNISGQYCLAAQHLHLFHSDETVCRLVDAWCQISCITRHDSIQHLTSERNQTDIGDYLNPVFDVQVEFLHKGFLLAAGMYLLGAFT